MKFKLEKLDGRHKGSSLFTHRAVVQGSKKLEKYKDFLKLRQWCWETWGPSCEREIYIPLALNNIDDRPYGWAWHYGDNYTECYIYLSGSKQLELFSLKWF